MSKVKNFITALEEHGIHPESWARAREAENAHADYLLARRVEAIVFDSEFASTVRLQAGETVHDLVAIVSMAAARWPLEEEKEEEVSESVTAA